MRIKIQMRLKKIFYGNVRFYNKKNPNFFDVCARLKRFLYSGVRSKITVLFRGVCQYNKRKKIKNRTFFLSLIH